MSALGDRSDRFDRAGRARVADRVEALLAESGLPDPALARAVGGSLGVLVGEAPAPSAELLLLLGGPAVDPVAVPGPGVRAPAPAPVRAAAPVPAAGPTPLRARGRRALAGALVLAVSGVGATGLSAAANTLPPSLQRHVADFSRAHLPFTFPSPPVRVRHDPSLSGSGADAPVPPERGPLLGQELLVAGGTGGSPSTFGAGTGSVAGRSGIGGRGVLAAYAGGPRAGHDDRDDEIGDGDEVGPTGVTGPTAHGSASGAHGGAGPKGASAPSASASPGTHGGRPEEDASEAGGRPAASVQAAQQASPSASRPPEQTAHPGSSEDGAGDQDGNGDGDGDGRGADLLGVAGGVVPLSLGHPAPASPAPTASVLDLPDGSVDAGEAPVGHETDRHGDGDD